ncbi:dephospho-CoA kinase [Pediococcus acidilactici]|uniref:Dephospho-CoA kinase n=2 Tax=Pediococcus acidilactici TaxID=1254 RepID=E0NES5_PEDAC|nr:dephospho-CoA kinase [Pediococcus acidilactici]AZP90471.1 dephospho-CoA kinase [Pediococcus acidilactici]EFA27060.1 dephospho-CoA kinase [Pediococcus acidilactici 7_4]EFL96086.1 dephospho-CoA kinase [Pediococcus acidilactici DSM 20284]KAF0371711.1 dephospho-CoA kinase [Pediococcus acidilactici]KAF0390683.1 dephospho-CoA kinase [Pediococcus acidilactici]
MTKILGLTGGIAMGKSTISNFLRDKGIPIVDADEIAHAVLEFKAVKVQLVKAFGTPILNEQKQVDRKQLGKIVFGESKKLGELNQIVQPVIRQEIIRQLKSFTTEPVVVLDAPVLFEQGYETLVDCIMVVSTTPAEQLRRLMERDHLTREDAQKRIDAQMPIEIKQKKADVTIDSSGSIEATQKQVIEWLVKQNLLQTSGKTGEVK